MATDWVIETHELTRRFKKVTAVSNLTLQVNRGEIFGLVGPDGAGKTTTIRLLAAILDPDEGWAKVDGFNTVSQPEPIKRRIGYMAEYRPLARCSSRRKCRRCTPRSRHSSPRSRRRARGCLAGKRRPKRRRPCRPCRSNPRTDPRTLCWSPKTGRARRRTRW